MDRLNIRGKRIAITGGAGVLGTALAKGFAEAGANVAILSRSVERAQEAAAQLGPDHIGVEVDVLDTESIQVALAACIKRLGGVDILVNGAGGNHPGATTGSDMPFFDIPRESFEFVSGLNLSGTILPSTVVV